MRGEVTGTEYFMAMLPPPQPHPKEAIVPSPELGLAAHMR